MMKPTPLTKRYKGWYTLVKILSILVNVLPILIFTVEGYIEGSNTGRTTLSVCLVLTAICLLINFVFKYHIRSTIWIMAIGLYACLDKMETMLLVIAICTMVDEFVFQPLCKHLYAKWQTNKTIDQRQNYTLKHAKPPKVEEIPKERANG